MKKASTKDILRTIWKEKKRFFAIMMITILGVTLMTGLKAGCSDLRYSADRFYDSQKLFDISIMSTLGLTEDDVLEIQTMEEVQKAEGTYSEIVHTKNGEVNKTAEVKVVKEKGLNIPHIVEGRLPQSAQEIAVDVIYLKETGKQIGDSLTIEEIMDEETKEPEEEAGKPEENDVEEADSDNDIDEIEIDMESDVDLEEEETPNFLYQEYKIVGTVIDVMDINNAEGSAAFRATPNADYTFFVTPQAVDSEVYTAVYVALKGTENLLCYSEEYEEKIKNIVSRIETEIMEQREIARYQQITKEAYDKIEEKENEMYDTFAEIEEEFADAWEEISEGWQELLDGKKELEDKEIEVKEEIQNAREELEDAYVQLSDAWEQLNEAEKQIHMGESQLEEGIELLKENEKDAKAQLKEAEELLNSKVKQNEETKQELNDSLTQMKALFGELWGKDTPLAQSWDAYVKATVKVVKPIIKEAMNSGEEVSEEQLQAKIASAIQEALENNTNNYAVVAYHLGTQVGTAISTLQNGILANGGTVQGLGTQKVLLEAELEELKKQENPDKSKIREIEEQLAGINGQLLILTWNEENTNQLMQLGTGIATCNATGKVLTSAVEAFKKQKEYALEQIESGWEQMREAQRELEEGWAQISDGRGQVIENYKKWQDGMAELDENEQKALQEFADARADLAEGEQELIDGEKELEEHKEEYREERSKAEDKIAEAKQEVADIDMTKWYVQDRTSLSGYVNVDSDTACIESLATVFTIVFFIVAILISLTSVTRMVEEERGLIGTYKALGFTDREIRSKYVIYAFGASALGAVLGDVGGFVILPEILFVFFKVMYLFPNYFLQFNVISGTVSGILFMIGIVGAAIVACYSELRHLPAYLMRPKAPKEGSRVILEFIPFLWKRMSFLNKVTARNLFRYKKRMIMTLFGIMGCTALLVFGLAIKDSVAELMPLQYETVYSYDLLAASSAEDNEKLTAYMEENAEVTEYLNLQVETVKLKNENRDTEKVQIMILPDREEISSYLTLKNESGQPVVLGDEGIYLTENASKILDLQVGDTAYIQKLDLTQESVQVASLVKNYLGNNIYMSQSAYEKVFGEYEPNGILANLSDSCEDQIAFSDRLAQEDWILSSVSTQELKSTFSQAFTLINIVVYVVLVLAAGLAFVVLFTLASINISERERELATIKVLGFFDKEVHSYVNKETLILTTIGILIGLPVGAALSSMLTDILNMPSIYFAVTIYNRSYWLAAGIALAFAFIVQLLTDRTLDVIDPVEALKSVE